MTKKMRELTGIIYETCLQISNRCSCLIDSATCMSATRRYYVVDDICRRESSCCRTSVCTSNYVSLVCLRGYCHKRPHLACWHILCKVALQDILISEMVRL